MDHEIVKILENSGLFAVYTLLNTIIYLKAVKYLKPAFRLTKKMSGLWLGCKIGFRKNKQTKNQRSAARERA